jgi:ABC-2 type transport system permease protein
VSALLRSELLKLRTTRTFFLLVSAALLLSLLVSGLAAALVQQPTEQDVRDFVFADASAIFILSLAVVGMTGEWRHRTITGTFLAVPDRARLLAAKVLAYAIAGAVLAAIVNVAVIGLGTAILSGRGEVTLPLAELAGLFWRQLVVAAAFGAMGVAVGALVRQQAAAIVLVLVVLFVVEPTLLGVAPDVGRFGPLLGAPSAFVGSVDDDELLGELAGFGVMVAWVAVLVAAAWAVLRERDLT